VKKTTTRKEVKDMEKIKRFFKDEEGATAAEYALLVALIAVVLIGGATFLGDEINSKLSGVGSVVSDAGTI
jgi:pilus assembly protein Flp/PilA